MNKILSLLNATSSVTVDASTLVSKTRAVFDGISKYVQDLDLSASF